MSTPTPSEPAISAGDAPPRQPLEGAIGRVAWNPPTWPQDILESLRTQPRQWAYGALALLLVVWAGWWVSRPVPPKPGALTVELSAPAVTDYTATPIAVHDLRIGFSGSAAAIKQVGNAPVGVTLSPELPGSWRWSDDRTLLFTPATDWPIAQDYTVSIDPTALAPGVHLTEDTLEFRTAPMRA